MLVPRSGSNAIASCSRCIPRRISKNTASLHRAASTSTSPISATPSRSRGILSKSILAGSAVAFLTYELTVNKNELRLEASKNVNLTSPTASLHAGIDQLGVFLWGSNKCVIDVAWHVAMRPHANYATSALEPRSSRLMQNLRSERFRAYPTTHLTHLPK